MKTTTRRHKPFSALIGALAAISLALALTVGHAPSAGAATAPPPAPSLSIQYQQVVQAGSGPLCAMRTPVPLGRIGHVHNLTQHQGTISAALNREIPSNRQVFGPLQVQFSSDESHATLSSVLRTDCKHASGQVLWSWYRDVGIWFASGLVGLLTSVILNAGAIAIFGPESLAALAWYEPLIACAGAAAGGAVFALLKKFSAPLPWILSTLGSCAFAAVGAAAYLPASNLLSRLLTRVGSGIKNLINAAVSLPGRVIALLNTVQGWAADWAQTARELAVELADRAALSLGSGASVCHLPDYGGNYLCGYGAKYWIFPDGQEQVFVIGTDYSVWTRWHTGPTHASPLSAWTKLGGIIRHSYTPADFRLVSVCDVIYIFVTGTDNLQYDDARRPNGNWTGWERPKLIGCGSLANEP